jgi:hypothetical protein
MSYAEPICMTIMVLGVMAFIAYMSTINRPKGNP